MTNRPREAAFKALVQRDLKTLRHAWFFKSQEVSIRGIPDMIICLGGRFVAIELKRDFRAKADALQRYNLNRIAEAGGRAIVASPESWDEILAELRLLDVARDEGI